MKKNREVDMFASILSHESVIREWMRTAAFAVVLILIVAIVFFSSL